MRQYAVDERACESKAGQEGDGDKFEGEKSRRDSSSSKRWEQVNICARCMWCG